MSEGSIPMQFTPFDHLAPPEVAAEPDGKPNLMLLLALIVVFEVGVILGFTAGAVLG